MTGSADTVVVLAKQPRPGRVKTRLSPTFTPDEAAQLAAAALRDTLRAVAAGRPAHRMLAWAGDPRGWDAGFTVVPQPEGDLNARLTAAFAAAYAGRGGGPTGRVLLVGMDTPQLRPEDLGIGWEGADAVLGLSEDGGFWAIGLSAGHPAGVFDRVPMSTDRTGAAQLARLLDLGLTVKLLRPLRDVDEPADAEAVATAYPGLEFAGCWRRLIGVRPAQPPDRLFDRLYTRGPNRGRTDGATDDDHTLVLDVDRWFADPDAADDTVLSRCRPPVLDLGCGPGRMVRALIRSGRAALGVDISAVAVDVCCAAGGPALRRRITDRLPAEGRWRTALLLDGSLGIGGDVHALLTRCRELLDPRGVLICEVDPIGERHQVRQIVLRSGSESSPPLPWARVGAVELGRLAYAVGLEVDEQWTSHGRAFMALRMGEQ